MDKEVIKSYPDDNQYKQVLKYKGAPNFPKVPQKVLKSVYAWKWMFLKQPKKSTHILATFVTKLDTKTFKKRPIWSHWIDNATNLTDFLSFLQF